MNNKISSLWFDKRSFANRLPAALLAAGSISFTFIIFGILDIYFVNKSSFHFYVNELIGPAILVALLVFVVLTAVMFVLRGAFFDIAVSLLIGVLLAGYIQGNFLNLDLGELTGAAIPWETYDRHATLNLMLWFVIILLPLVIRYFSLNVWNKLIVLLPILLIGMQAASLVSVILVDNTLLTNRADMRYLSSENMYEVASDENIIVFVLDSYDRRDVDALLEDDPTALNGLDGFTYFEDHLSLYWNTYPSVSYMFSGMRPDTVGGPREGYLYDAWNTSAATFLKDLKDEGYEVDIYARLGHVYLDAAPLEGVVANVTDVPLNRLSINREQMLDGMLRLSGFRYAPHALKASYWVPSEFMDDVVIFDAEEEGAYNLTDDKVYDGLIEQGLNISQMNKRFAYYHLRGVHPPYMMTEDAERVERTNDPAAKMGAMKGSIKIINTFLEQMKQKGVYKDATIIVTADHGFWFDYVESLEMEERIYPAPIWFIKPAGAEGESLKRTAAQTSCSEFMATVLDAAGLDYQNYGMSVWDISPEENRTREAMVFQHKYIINGDSRINKNWSFIKEIE